MRKMRMGFAPWPLRFSSTTAGLSPRLIWEPHRSKSRRKISLPWANSFAHLQLECPKPSATGGTKLIKVELLDLFGGALLNFPVKAVTVGVNRHHERAEIFDPEFPQALGHQVLPPDLFNLFNLRRLQRRGATDDRQVHSTKFLHCLNTRLQQSGLAHNHPNLVTLQQAGYKAVHARTRGGSDGKLFVFSVRKFFDAGRGVNAHGARQVRRRLNPFVENANLRRVPDSEDRSVDQDGILKLELADVGLAQRRF